MRSETKAGTAKRLAGKSDATGRALRVRNAEQRAADSRSGQLAQRLNKVRGQLDAVERALDEGRECGDQLMLLAAVRGGVNALMGAVLETHIREHMTADARQKIAPDLADDLLRLVRAYLK